MSQVSLVREEARNKGSKRTIKLAAIAAGSVVQYSRDHVKLKGSISLDEVNFQGFNVVNLDGANPTVIDMITVIPAFERSLLREKMKSKKEIYRRGF
jgi:hypothetical protein